MASDSLLSHNLTTNDCKQLNDSNQLDIYRVWTWNVSTDQRTNLSSRPQGEISCLNVWNSDQTADLLWASCPAPCGPGLRMFKLLLAI